MSVGAILTLGLGSFGSVNLLPTLGYLSGSAAPARTDQPSNWQADYWKHPKSRTRKEREEDEREERILLGILPPELRIEADQAIRDADEAQRELAAGRVEASNALGVAMQARETYENAYKQAYREAYIAAVVAEHWKEDMRRITWRRKAAILLLH